MRVQEDESLRDVTKCLCDLMSRKTNVFFDGPMYFWWVSLKAVQQPKSTSIVDSRPEAQVFNPRVAVRALTYPDVPHRTRQRKEAKKKKAAAVSAPRVWSVW
jgi:hypothetical protein